MKVLKMKKNKGQWEKKIAKENEWAVKEEERPAEEEGRSHSKNDYVKMTHFVKMTYCQGNKSMLLLHTSSYYNKVMLH